MKQFEEIWHEYYPKLTIYLRTSFRFDDTDDLVQEIMIKIHSNIHTYKVSRSLSTWIYTIARNHAVDAVRKNISRIRLLETVKNETAFRHPSADSPESAVMDEQLKDDIAAFIGSLPDTERQTAFLKYYEQMKYREISRIMKIPEGTVKYHVHSIKKKFAQYYGENYED